MPSNHLILCHPLLLLPSIIPNIRVFSSELALCIRWPKNWSFSFSISPYNEYSGLISFRIYWFELFAVQGTFKNLLQHHSLKASILWHSTFFVIQHSHPYMTTENTITFLERCSYFKVYKWIIHYQCPGSFFICSDLFCNLQSQFSFLVCWNFKLKFLRLFEILDYPPLNMAEIGH